MGEVNLSAYVLAMQYAQAEMNSGREEIELLQACLEAVLRIERADMIKGRTTEQKDLMFAFQAALTKLSNFRSKERRRKDGAKSVLKKSKALKSQRPPEDDE